MFFCIFLQAMSAYGADSPACGSAGPCRYRRDVRLGSSRSCGHDPGRSFTVAENDVTGEERGVPRAHYDPMYYEDEDRDTPEKLVDLPKIIPIRWTRSACRSSIRGIAGYAHSARILSRRAAWCLQPISATCG